MELSIILGIIAGLADIYIVVLYNKHILTGECRPNMASWGLWAFLAILGFTSYFAMTGDWVKCILSAVSAIACIGTFIFSLFKGNINKLGKFDYWALAIGIIAALVWRIYNNATFGNLLLQLCYLISFIPTYRSVWKNSKNEKPLPWLVWTATFAAQTIIVLLRWQGQYQDLAGPVSGFITCGAVAILALRKT